MTKPHILLIHGAYHRAWHLQFLAAELEEAGHSVSMTDLPSGDENARASGGLAADTNAIRALMEEVASSSDSIVPVFHSYSGIPGSEAAATVSPATAKKISRIIYIAAFVIPQGEALSTPFGGKLAPWSEVSENGLWASVPDPIPLFYHDVEPELAKEASRHVVPYSTSAFHDHTKRCGWKLFPKTFIYCAADAVLPMEYWKQVFAAMSDEDRAGWHFETIEGGHSPFLAKPAECSRLIRKIIGDEIES